MTRREMLIQEGARKAYKGYSNEAVSARTGYARGYKDGYHQAVADTWDWFAKHVTASIGENMVIDLPTYTDVMNNYLGYVEVDPMFRCKKED